MLPDGNIAAIIRGHVTLHVYGYICYGDLFGSPLRRFKFCQTAINVVENAGAGAAIQWIGDWLDVHTVELTNFRRGNRSVEH